MGLISQKDLRVIIRMQLLDKKNWTETNPRKRQPASKLPASPGFCPHLGFISLVWGKVIAVETIAGVYLLNIKHGVKKNNQTPKSKA